MEAIKCKGLSFCYPNKTENALSDVSFSLKKGEFCAVLGASGSGKSTLLKLMKKEISPHGTRGGSIQITGTVGYVSQHFEESTVSDTVYGELAFSPTHAGLSAEEIRLLVAETAAYFHLSNKLDAPVSALSGGEKQILCLASVMMMKPDILLLDEPFSQLDPVAAAAFADVLRTVHRDFGTAVLLAAHALEECWHMLDSILLLDGGRVCMKEEKNAAATRLVQTESPMTDALPVFLRMDEAAQRSRSVDVATLPQDKPQLEAKHLYFAYQKGKDVLRDASLALFPGKIHAVIGENGSGKTTLLKALCGVRRAYRGKVKTKASISMLPQNVYDLFTHETCAQEVHYGELTDRLALADIANSHPFDISGGQAQRLALVKVLQTGADILLLDEPAKGLDPVLKAQLGTLLWELCAEGKTVLLVTHDLEFAGRYADVASLMSCGSMVATMPAPALFRKLHFYTTPSSRLTGGKLI